MTALSAPCIVHNMIIDDRDHDSEDYAHLDYAESILARRLARGDQTPAQHRAAAIALLRDIVDDPNAKPNDRRQAASDLLKLGVDEVDPAARAVMQYTDAQLLAFIEDARAERAAQPATPATPAPPPPPPGVPSPETGTFSQEVQRIDPTPLSFWKPTVAAPPASDFEFNLDGIADYDADVLAS